MVPADGRCPNCGADAPSRFCPDCGQSTALGVPTLRELILDTLGAALSYDSKVGRTAWRLARHPGALTVDYFAGRRAAFLSPFQVFFWLQTLAFLADGAVFHDSPATIAAKNRSLALMGIVIAVALSGLYARRRLRFVRHLVAAAHLWAFLMLLLLVEYALVPLAAQALLALGLLRGPVPEGLFVTGSTKAAMVVYTVVALRRVYGVVWAVAILQTLAVFALYTLVARLIAGAAGIA